MKALALFGIAYLAVPLSTMLGIPHAALPQTEPVAEVQADPPLPVVEAEVIPEPPKEKTVDELIDQYFGKAAGAAKKVFTCESGLRPDAVGDLHLQFTKNGTSYGASYGVAQIRYLPGRPNPDELMNAEFNIRYAADMYHSQGWHPWTCRKVL